MSVFQLSMLVVGVLTRYANGTILVNVPHLTRAKIVSLLQLMSFLGIALASYYSSQNSMFYVAIFSSALTGISSGMGEATFLGFLKGFPSHLVGAVSCGTGFAGISGTFILLILQTIGLSNFSIFILVSPTVLIYLASF